MPCGKRLLLEVGVPTFGPDGMQMVEKMNLPRLDGVCYLVSWQMPEGDIPESIACRDDVRVLKLNSKGLSRNRNNILAHARGDVVFFADNDLMLYPEGLKGIAEAFVRIPSLEFGVFKFESEIERIYPEGECSLERMPKYFYPGSMFALRMDSRAGKLRFNEDFGLGADKFTAGEDDLLLMKARRLGLDCRYLPVAVAWHPGASTGFGGHLDKKAIAARGVLTAAEWPWTAPLRLLLGAWRIWRKGQASLVPALYHITRGALYGYLSQAFYNYLRKL